VKILVIGFAILSLVFVVLAADEWNDRPDEGEPAASNRGALRGGLILFAVSLLSLASLWVAAAELGWRRDRVLWVGFGLFLAGMTLTRPWWFWENYKARWLRDLIGDELTAGIYLTLASVMVWVGLFTDWTFGRR
jgi:hypothetical protein